MASNLDTGKLGEDIACDFLRKNSFSILFRNMRNKFGELDIVAKDRDGTLVFVEVKTMRQIGNTEALADLMPEDQMSGAKMKKFRRSAEFFANEHPHLIDDVMGWRLDCIAITLNAEGNSPAITHYKNI